ncbi:MAG: 50S ribosomal protein L24 [Holosporaceae bacterium]|jgi:large subunit ribosomal protein L24|nr:50S ribosomal protein L24 [Holosporaceae bacterium]
MNSWRIKKGDMVQVIAGKDRGRSGEILMVLRDERRVVVKGVNVCVKHRKPSAASPGGIEKNEQSIHASNVMLLDVNDDRPTRVGMKIIDGKKVRVSKRTGTVIA